MVCPIDQSKRCSHSEFFFPVAVVGMIFSLSVSSADAYDVRDRQRELEIEQRRYEERQREQDWRREQERREHERRIEEQRRELERRENYLIRERGYTR